MNLIILKGRLTRDVELKQSNSGKPYTKITVAVDRPVARGQEKQADFINCTAFNKTAELLAGYFHKGSNILLEGSLQIDNYTNKDGQKVSSPNVFINRIEFIDSRNSAPQQSAMESFGTPALDEDIPF